MKHKIKIICSILIAASVIFSFTEKSAAVPINAYIDNVNPPMNAVSVNKSSNITVVFTQSMNPSTINNSNIKVFGYKTGLLSVALSYNHISKTLTINPNQDMKIGEEISVTMTNGIMTEGGQSITPFVYKFTIQALGGNGIFIRTSGIPNIQSAYLKSGDIDGDVDIDLIVNNKIYKNNGNAVFTFFGQLNHDGIPELADFDNDGDLDILMQVDSSVYFYRNDGTGNFTLTYSFIGGIEKIGDLNGSGYLDVIYFTSSGSVGILKNNSGIFLIDTVLSFGNHEYKDLMVADFNNDGALDICEADGDIMEFLGQFYLYRDFYYIKNNGLGNFVKNYILSDQPNGNLAIYTYKGAKSFDYDNDGYVDIIAPAAKIKNNGNETFSQIANSGFNFSTSLASDFNGDGFIDVVHCTNYFFMPPLFYSMNINGNFLFTQGNPNNFITLTEGDFDNDGDIDIAAFDYNAQEVSILINSDIPSPVELSSLTSTINSNTVTLNWTTTVEENNSGFDIERKDLRHEWSKIGFVLGKGNSNSSQNYSFTDRNLSSGKYNYRLKQIDFNGNFKYYNLSEEAIIGIPDKSSLSQNYPNPFNPKTIIRFDITPLNPPFAKGGNGGFVLLKVYNSVGKEVMTLVNEKKEAGYYEASFDGSNLPSGMYFYRLSVNGNTIDTKRMVLVK